MAELIGLCGQRGSGKDTAFGFIDEWAHNQWKSERRITTARRAIADELKYSFARMFVPSMNRMEAVTWCNRIKHVGKLTLSDVHATDNGDTKTTLIHEISGRVALQRYGVEGHREIFGDNFWLDALLPRENWESNFRIGITNEFADICVVTDIRFADEAERVEDLGGQIWRVERPGLPEPDNHSSEQGVPDKYIDRVIMNDSDLNNLREQVFKLMDDCIELPLGESR